MTKIAKILQNRRNFIKKTALSTAGIGAFTILPSTVWAGKVAPSDKVNVAIIGCRGKGFAILKFFLDNSEVNCTAMCDVDRKMMEERAAVIKEEYNQKPKLYKEKMPSLVELGKRYKALLDLGQKTGVMPQLEFWGASETLFHIGQAFMVAAIANDPDARMLPDVYHMFKGGSGYESLKMLNGNFIELFNPEYWKQDQLKVAKTGLIKMKGLVNK